MQQGGIWLPVLQGEEVGYPHGWWGAKPGCLYCVQQEGGGPALGCSRGSGELGGAPVWHAAMGPWPMPCAATDKGKPFIPILGASDVIS